MAVSFTSVETTAWIGAVNGIPTTLCGQNGRMVWVPIDWRIYGVGAGDNLGLTVDMTGIAPTNMLDLIRSVYIDNLASPTYIYIQFPDTGFTAFMPPYSKGWCPVLTNARQATIYGIGFNANAIPLTNVFFTNIFVPDSITTSSPDANVTPATLIYQGTNLVSAGGGAVATVFNHAAVPFGTASAARRILIAALGMYGDGSLVNHPASVSAMTIGGVAATLFAQNEISEIFNPILSIHASYNWNIAFGIANVPTGATGTVAVTYSANRNASRVYAYELYGVISDSVFDSTSSSAGGGLNVGNAALALQNIFSSAARGAAASLVVAGKKSAVPDEPVIGGADKAIPAGTVDTITPVGGTVVWSTISNPLILNDIGAANPAQTITANYAAVSSALMNAGSFSPS